MSQIRSIEKVSRPDFFKPRPSQYTLCTRYYMQGIMLQPIVGQHVYLIGHKHGYRRKAWLLWFAFVMLVSNEVTTRQRDLNGQHYIHLG